MEEFTNSQDGLDVQGGGVPTWSQIVDRHSDQVYRLALRLTGNQHDAEDLTQEVFLRVFRSLHLYKPGTFAGWLHRITTNLYLDQARRKQRIRFEPMSSDSSRLVVPMRSGEAMATETLFDADVENALAALPPDFRVAVVLCDIEGLTYEEIADILGVKMGTIRSRISRGRAMLRESLAHRAPRGSRKHFLGPRLSGQLS